MLRYLVLAGLFFALSPGNFLTLPRGGSKRTVAMVHALAFVVAYYLSVKVAEMLMVDLDEGFKSIQGEMVAAPNLIGPSVASVPSIDGVPFPLVQHNALRNECYRIRFEKDNEYNARGDNTPRFRELDRQQGAACDSANAAMDNAVRLGYAVKPYDYNDYKSKATGGSTGSMGGSNPTTTKPDAIRIKDMFGRSYGYCVNPYDCVRGTGWTRGYSTCKCLNNSPPLAVFRDATIPAHVMQYVKYK